METISDQASVESSPYIALKPMTGLVDEEDEKSVYASSASPPLSPLVNEPGVSDLPRHTHRLSLTQHQRLERRATALTASEQYIHDRQSISYQDNKCASCIMDIPVEPIALIIMVGWVVGIVVVPAMTGAM